MNADIFGRKRCKTVTAGSGKLRSFVQCEKTHEWKRSIAALTKRDFCDCCRSRGHFRYDAERAKRFVNAHWHRIVSNMERISKVSSLSPPPLEKFLRTPMVALYRQKKTYISSVSTRKQLLSTCVCKSRKYSTNAFISIFKGWCIKTKSEPEERVIWIQLSFSLMCWKKH